MRVLSLLLVTTLISSAAFAQEEEPLAIGVWNGFNRHINVVECSNISGEDATLKIKLYSSEIGFIGEQLFELTANGSPHLVLNSFPIENSHGTYTLEQVIDDEDDIPTIRPHCITAFYRFSEPGSNSAVEYAFSLPTLDEMTGVSAGTYNSINSGGDEPILNWLSVVNPGEEFLNGVVQVYDQEGFFSEAHSIEDLAPNGRIDIPLGHTEGQVVGMYRVLLFDEDAPYMAFLTRYSQSLRSGTAVFNFAFPLLAQKGLCDSGPIPASTMDPASNWGEILNPTLKSVSARIIIRGPAGNTIHEEVRTIDSFAQEHIYLNAYLGERNIGSFQVQCLDPEDDEQLLITQSLFYGHPAPGDGGVVWAYASQAQGRFVEPGDALVAPANTSLNMVNWFKLWSDTSKQSEIQETVYDQAGFPLGEQTRGIRPAQFHVLNPGGSFDLPIHSLAGHDFIGTATASSTTLESRFGGEFLRIFPSRSGGIGYIMAVPAARVSNALTANKQVVSASVDKATEITLTASNEEEDIRFHNISQQPEHGYLRGSFPNITYHPDERFVGQDEFWFRVYDGTGWSRPNRVLIDVDHWIPSLGVPEPSFGLVEKAPSAPSPWTSATPGFYYIDRHDPSATDVDNPFGSSIIPRQTIPVDLPPGSVVEIHGDYDYAPGGASAITANGTAAQPIFFRGADPENPPHIQLPWHVTGSYLIFENLFFDDLDGDRDEGHVAEMVILGPAHHISVRYNEFRGNDDNGGIHVLGWLGQATNNIVIYDNEIHDNGQSWRGSERPPVHGVDIGPDTSHVWVVENSIRGNGGDGVHIDSGALGSMNSTHHIYVSENSIWSNRYSGTWVRHAVDVVVSENSISSHRPTELSPGACLGFEYGPSRVWFLNNSLHNCEVGIASGSSFASRPMGPGDNIYIIGNIIRDMSNTGDNGDGAMKDGAGIRLTEPGPVKYIVNNTIHDNNVGIAYANAESSIVMSNNIIADINDEHIWMEHPTTAVFSIAHDILFDESPSIKWGSNIPLNVSAFQQAFQGQCGGCLEVDPEFENGSRNNFRLTEGSPAKDAGSGFSFSQINQAFKTLYNLDLDKDIDNNPRVMGSELDIGAYEYEPEEED